MQSLLYLEFFYIFFIKIMHHFHRKLTLWVYGLLYYIMCIIIITYPPIILLISWKFSL